MDLMKITGEHWHEHNFPISTLMDNWIQRDWGDTSMGMSGLTNQHPRLRLCEAEKTDLQNNSSAVNVGTRRPHTTYLSKCYVKKWSLRDDFRRVPQGKWYQIYTMPGFYGVTPLWRILLYSLCQRPWPHPVCEVGACFVKGPDQDDGHYRAGIQRSEAYSQAQWWRLLIHVSNYIFFCFLDKGTKKYGAYFSGFSGCSKVFFLR